MAVLLEVQVAEVAIRSDLAAKAPATHISHNFRWIPSASGGAVTANSLPSNANQPVALVLIVPPPPLHRFIAGSALNRGEVLQVVLSLPFAQSSF